MKFIRAAAAPLAVLLAFLFVGDATDLLCADDDCRDWTEWRDVPAAPTATDPADGPAPDDCLCHLLFTSSSISPACPVPALDSDVTAGDAAPDPPSHGDDAPYPPPRS